MSQVGSDIQIYLTQSDTYWYKTYVIIMKSVDWHFKNVDHFEFVTSTILRGKDFLELGIKLKYFSIPFIGCITYYINVSGDYLHDTSITIWNICKPSRRQLFVSVQAQILRERTYFGQLLSNALREGRWDPERAGSWTGVWTDVPAGGPADRWTSEPMNRWTGGRSGGRTGGQAGVLVLTSEHWALAAHS